MSMRYIYIKVCIFFLFIITTSCSCSRKKNQQIKTIIAIPVYGQSLASGEEAVRITNFDSLSRTTGHRLLTENLDEEFGYLSDTHAKQWLKKLLHDRRRAFEIGIYGMSEIVSDYLYAKGDDSTLICSFPGGQGAAGIQEIKKGTKAYVKFLEEIEIAYKLARGKGWAFVVPAYLWMQGEDDIVWNKSKQYKNDLKTFQHDFNRDVKRITGQSQDVKCISYQTNCISLSPNFNSSHFYSREMLVPQAQMELIRDDESFLASGPTYPYAYVDERVHLDGISQKKLGFIAGLTVIRMMENKESKGLIPTKISIRADTVVIGFNVPYPPLVIGTILVNKSYHFGFSVINKKNQNILRKVIIDSGKVKLYCLSSPKDSRVKYGVNGTPGKSGSINGPRGNLRDSQGKSLLARIGKETIPMHNWCYQFDLLIH